MRASSPPELHVVTSGHHRPHAPRSEFFHGRLVAYPDVPERIERIKARLERLDRVTFHEPQVPLSEQQLAQTHDPGLLAYLRRRSQEAAGFLEREFQAYGMAGDTGYLYPSVFPPRPDQRHTLPQSAGCDGYYAFDANAPIGSATWEAACYSAATAAAAAALIRDERARLAYALCRPPGHHAGTGFIGGYCYLNNAAVAANLLRATGPGAILDIDYHHGNGTQDIFWDTPDVFVGSLHADPRLEYPYYAGYEAETGGPRAPHTNCNIPLPPGTDRPAYLRALDRLLSRIAAFGPRWLVVSAGFDTSIHDSVGLFALPDDAYPAIGQAIAQLGVPVLLVQEGGYHLDTLGSLAELLVGGLR